MEPIIRNQVKSHWATVNSGDVLYKASLACLVTVFLTSLFSVASIFLQPCKLQVPMKLIFLQVLLTLHKPNQTHIQLNLPSAEVALSPSSPASP